MKLSVSPQSIRNLSLDETGLAGPFTIGWCLTISAVIISLALIVVLFGEVKLPEFPQFVPLHVTFVFLLDSITAFLLFGQFHYRRLLLYLILGCGYFFNASVSISFLLAFPGFIQTEGGIIGGPQSAIWLWHYWHIIFPLFVTVALILHNTEKGKTALPQERLWLLTNTSMAAIILLVVALTITVTIYHDSLPVLIDVTQNSPLTPAFYWAGSTAAVITFLALTLAWWHGRRKIVLHLWLAVVMAAFLADVTTSLAANQRYTVGWYFGRIEAIIAASVLLLLFLGEVMRLYQWLATTNRELRLVIEQKDQAEADLAKKNCELELLAKTDHLTKLANRNLIVDTINELINKAKRYKRPFSIIILDIDHFKKINDSHGHNIGDAVLQKLAAVMVKRVRTTDTVGRWGGEEFLITCAETELNRAVELAEALRAIIEKTSFNLPYSVTASFGVAQYYKNEKFETFLQRTDNLLYIAKRNGRNQVVATSQKDQKSGKASSPNTVLTKSGR